VQSVATRIVVERERERMRFVSARYWDLGATFHKIGELDEGEPRSFTATLTGLDGKRVATGRDFDSQGKTKSDEVVVIADLSGRRSNLPRCRRQLDRDSGQDELAERGVGNPHEHVAGHQLLGADRLRDVRNRSARDPA
jgi:hypothetical protein